jgi:predicted permease
MSWLDGFLHRVYVHLHPETYAREREEEARFHEEMETAERSATVSEANGVRVDPARLTPVQDKLPWTEGFSDRLRQDLRYAIRSLIHTPGFTVMVMLTLALGVGANTTMFGVLDTILLKPPAHVRDPGRVQRVYILQDYGHGQIFTMARTSVPTYEALRDVPAFQSMAASFLTSVSLGRGADARSVDVGAVTASYFSLLGAQPALGRFFTSTEDRVGAAPLAVVSYRYWRRELQGDPSVLERTLPIGRSDYVIVGVAPEGFTGGDSPPPDVWLPLRTAASDLNIAPFLSSRFWPGITMLARLAPGATPADAATEATLVYRRASGKLPSKAKVLLRSIQEARSLKLDQRGSSPGMSSDAQVALWLAGLALAVLLIACANVANLLLARGLARRRELAVRLGLGAGRTRLIRHVLAESGVLAAGGGAGALLVAVWGGAAMRAFLLPGLPHSAKLLEPRLLLFTAGVATLAGVLAGAVPAWQLSGADTADLLRSGGRDVTATRGRLRSSLLALQLALTLTLLVGAGLFVRSLRNGETLDYGMDLQHVLIASVEMGYPFTHGEQDRQSAMYLRLLRHIQANPAVVSAAASVGTPYRETFAIRGLKVSGRDSLSGVPALNAVTADYFAALGTPIVRGRGFTEADEASGASPVAVVGQTFARLAWSDRDPIGQCVFLGKNDATCARVIGVAGDTRTGGIRNASPLDFYVPYGQHLFSQPLTGLLIRTRPPAAEAEGEVQHALQSAAPDLPYVRAESLANRIAPMWQSWKLGAAMFTAFGLLALVIAALGLYAVSAYGVTQRTQEIGVRIALGAERRDVVWLAVRQALGAAAIGAGAGLLAALLLSRAMRALLFEVQPADPVTLVVSIGLLLLVAAGAAFVPARRAVRADPVVALRQE